MTACIAIIIIIIRFAHIVDSWRRAKWTTLHSSSSRWLSDLIWHGGHCCNSSLNLRESIGQVSFLAGVVASLKLVSSADDVVTGHLAIWLDAVLQAEELPASIANLDTTLTEMKAEDLTHDYEDREFWPKEKAECKAAGGLSRNVTDQLAGAKTKLKSVGNLDQCT